MSSSAFTPHRPCFGHGFFLPPALALRSVYVVVDQVDLDDPSHGYRLRCRVLHAWERTCHQEWVFGSCCQGWEDWFWCSGGVVQGP